MNVLYVELLDSSWEEINFNGVANIEIGASGNLLISLPKKPGEMSVLCYANGTWKTFNVIEEQS